ncbi:hypothetical protein D3C74_26890 [compost metagenome]
MNTYLRGVVSLSLIGILLLTACGATEKSNIEEQHGNVTTQQTAETTPSQNVPDTPAHKESLIDPASKEPNDITSANFKPGIFIEFENYKRSFFNDDFISKLNGAFQAVVDQNESNFKEYLNNEPVELIAHNLYFSNKKELFMFYDLDLLERLNEPEQIRVGVRYAKKSIDGDVQNEAFTFFFTKNKQGEWGIENID